jgi:hypothetical protein
VCSSDLVPPPGEPAGEKGCHSDENFGVTDVKGIIRTDTLTCQHDPWSEEDESGEEDASGEEDVSGEE